jgi:hypothetical protein
VWSCSGSAFNCNKSPCKRRRSNLLFLFLQPSLPNSTAVTYLCTNFSLVLQSFWVFLTRWIWSLCSGNYGYSCPIVCCTMEMNMLLPIFWKSLLLYIYCHSKNGHRQKIRLIYASLHNVIWQKIKIYFQDACENGMFHNTKQNKSRWLKTESCKGLLRAYATVMYS